jgi:hypothetical protein
MELSPETRLHEVTTLSAGHAISFLFLVVFSAVILFVFIGLKFHTKSNVYFLSKKLGLPPPVTLRNCIPVEANVLYIV